MKRSRRDLTMAETKQAQRELHAPEVVSYCKERTRAEKAEAALVALRAALQRLRIDANRLCDRQLGGTYEDDCRRSIAMADAVLKDTDASR